MLSKNDVAERNAHLTEIVRLRAALGDLHALVLGECPRLLNEDSGGSAELDLKIRALLNL